MSELQSFVTGGLKLPVRLTDSGEVEFDVEQAAIGLGICQLKNGKQYVRWERVAKYLNSPLVGKSDFISESQFYRLAFKADNPVADKFQDWVTKTVLPSIRKTGGYVAPQTAADWLENPDMMIEALKRYKDAKEENQRLHDERKIMLPKARFADAVSDASNSILIRELAKLLRQNGIDMGEKRLYTWLRDNQYLIRQGADYNRPTQKSMEMELFWVKETIIQHADGHTTVKGTTKVTGKGQRYFIDKILKIKQEA